ncbi:MAG TPA: serpin family protein, partial [Proteobacteria bacterium]|nr:serpin family protein [Pseudomonadota bacterium]
MKKKSAVLVLLIINIAVISTLPDNGLPDQADSSAGNDLRTVVEGGNRFALELYQRLSRSEGNLFFSPMSIDTALAMTYPGAAGSTAAQISSVLGLPPSGEKSTAGFSALLSQLNHPRSFNDQTAYDLIVANALWGQEGYPFKPEYISLLSTGYGAVFKDTDFRESEAARKDINDWVAEKTRDKIKDLVPPGILNALTRLVLVNAIYFKSNWQNRFEENGTKKEPFHLSAGDPVDVPMMRQQHRFGYMENSDLQMIELPYTWNDLSMLVLLPGKADDLASLEAKLSTENLASWQRLLSTRLVELLLPKFTFTSEFRLSDPLKEIGMIDAFDPEKADF